MAIYNPLERVAYDPSKWTQNEDGSWDVDDNVYLERSDVDRSGHLKCKFNKVSGDFYVRTINSRPLTSFKEFPFYVGKDLSLEGVKCSDTEGFPEEIGRNLDLNGKNNNITFTKFAKIIGNDILMSSNTNSDYDFSNCDMSTSRVVRKFEINSYMVNNFNFTKFPKYIGNFYIEAYNSRISNTINFQEQLNGDLTLNINDHYNNIVLPKNINGNIIIKNSGNNGCDLTFPNEINGDVELIDHWSYTDKQNNDHFFKSKMEKIQGNLLLRCWKHLNNLNFIGTVLGDLKIDKCDKLGELVPKKFCKNPKERPDWREFTISGPHRIDMLKNYLKDYSDWEERIKQEKINRIKKFSDLFDKEDLESMSLEELNQWLDENQSKNKYIAASNFDPHGFDDIPKSENSNSQEKSRASQLELNDDDLENDNTKNTTNTDNKNLRFSKLELDDEDNEGSNNDEDDKIVLHPTQNSRFANLEFEKERLKRIKRYLEKESLPNWKYLIIEDAKNQYKTTNQYLPITEDDLEEYWKYEFPNDFENVKDEKVIKFSLKLADLSRDEFFEKF